MTSMILNGLIRIFKDKLMDDQRSPAFSFDLLDYHVDFLAPNYQFYVQILVLLSLQMMAGCILSIIMYYGIMVDSSKDGVKSYQGYLVGYGIVMPLALWLPFYILDILDIRSVSFRLGLVCLPMTITLRCFESMYGFARGTPTGNNNNSREETTQMISLWDYVLDVGWVVKPHYDPTTGQAYPLTWSRFAQGLHYHVSWLLVFTVGYHVLEPFQFFPFATSVEAPNQVWIAWDVAHWYNTFLQATMMNAVLAFSVSGVATLAALYTRVTFQGAITNNPMFQSTSPSDFWGRRWNNLIHSGLKQGVYKPVRWTTGNRVLASIAAFVVSGLYHEYVWIVLFTPTSAQWAEGMHPDNPQCCQSCYCHGWMGKQLLFFAWNGAVIALEYALGDKISPWTQPLPQWLKSHLVVLLSLPVGHLFTADVTLSGGFQSLRQALPLFVITRQRHG